METKLIIAGISTDVGKTLVSAVLCQKLSAFYHKPIQAGSLERSDSHVVAELSANLRGIIPEHYRLKMAASPHQAAEAENTKIDFEELVIPPQEPLIIELAGGIMSPVNERYTFLDYIIKAQLPLVLVCNYYLGSINHTLLSIEVLKRNQVPILGLVFNDTAQTASQKSACSSRDFILRHSKLPSLLEVPPLEKIDSEIVANLSDIFHFFFKKKQKK